MSHESLVSLCESLRQTARDGMTNTVTDECRMYLRGWIDALKLIEEFSERNQK